MNNFISYVRCVCTSSGHKRVCEKHDIGAQCGPLPQTQQLKLENIDATIIQQNHQSQQKFSKKP